MPSQSLGCLWNQVLDGERENRPLLNRAFLQEKLSRQRAGECGWAAQRPPKSQLPHLPSLASQGVIAHFFHIWSPAWVSIPAPVLVTTNSLGPHGSPHQGAFQHSLPRPWLTLFCPPQDSVYIFRDGALPPYRQMFYQLCDLNVEEYVPGGPGPRGGA